MQETGDTGSIPKSGRAPGEEMATRSTILAWRIPMDRGAWWATVHGVTKSQAKLSIWADIPSYVKKENVPGGQKLWKDQLLQEKM